MRLARPLAPPHFVCAVVAMLFPAFLALGSCLLVTPSICIQGLGQPSGLWDRVQCRRPVTQCSVGNVARRTPGPSWAAATTRGGLLMLSVPPRTIAGCFA